MRRAVVLCMLVAYHPSNAQDLCTTFSGQWGYGRIFDVVVRDGLAYSIQGADLVIADVTEPGAPVELGRVNVPDGGLGLTVGGGVAYAGCELDLCVVSVVDPARPSLVARVPMPFIGVYDLVLNGDYLYCMGWRLWVLDVADPARPELVATLEHTQGRMDIGGQYAYHIDAYDGLSVLDLADPLHPMIVGEYRTGWDASDVAVSNGRAYIADGLAGVHAVEIGACQTLFVDNLESGTEKRWSLAVP